MSIFVFTFSVLFDRLLDYDRRFSSQDCKNVLSKKYLLTPLRYLWQSLKATLKVHHPISAKEEFSKLLTPGFFLWVVFFFLVVTLPTFLPVFSFLYPPLDTSRLRELFFR